MKTLNIGLCLAAGMLALHSQNLPTPATAARLTNAPAAPTNSLMNRAPDFGRARSNAVSGAATQAVGTGAAPVAGPGPASANNPSLPTVRPGGGRVFAPPAAPTT